MSNTRIGSNELQAEVLEMAQTTYFWMAQTLRSFLLPAGALDPEEFWEVTKRTAFVVNQCHGPGSFRLVWSSPMPNLQGTTDCAG